MKKDMTIDEVKVMKKEFEKTLRLLVEKFETETGTRVWIEHKWKSKENIFGKSDDYIIDYIIEVHVSL